MLLKTQGRIQSIKAGPVEVSLARTSINQVAARVGLKEKKDRNRLRKILRRQIDDLKQLQGARILWIDDNPARLVGERRILRALGVHVETAGSSDGAEKVLEGNPDFDLIITDVQRLGDNYKFNRGIRIHDGVNFIVKLYSVTYWEDRARQRGELEETELLRELIGRIPIIFYGAYDTKRLIEFTKPARAVCPDVDICNDFFVLIEKATSRLKEVRARNTYFTILALGGKKVPTIPV